MARHSTFRIGRADSFFTTVSSQVGTSPQLMPCMGLNAHACANPMMRIPPVLPVHGLV